MGMNEKEKHELLQQPAREQALAVVEAFEKDARLACAPERFSKPIITSMHSLTMQRYCFSPDGKQIAIASRRFVYLWDLPTNKMLLAYDANEWVEALTFSPDGKQLITGGSDNIIRFRDVVGGQCLRELHRHQRRIMRMGISPDGRWLVTNDYYAVGIWDLQGGTCHQWLDESSGKSINDFAISADSQMLYLAVGKKIRLVVMGSGKTLREIQRKQKIHQIAVNSDGETLVVKEGGHYSLRLIDARTENERTIEGCYSVHSFTLSPDRKILATGAEENLRLWDLDTGICKALIEEMPSSFSPIVFSPDGQQLLAHARGLQLHAIPTGQTRTVIHRAASRCDCSVFAADGQVLVTDGPDGSYNVWDLRTGKVRTRLINPVDKPTSVRVYPSGKIFVFSPDKKLLVGRTKEETLLVWDMTYGKCLRTFRINTRAKTPALAVHPDGRTIAYNDGEQVIVRHLRTDEVHILSTTGMETIRSLAFTQDGRYLVSLDQETLRQWDVASGQCLRTVRLLDYCKISENNFGNYVRLIDPEKLTFILGEFSFDETPPKVLWDSLSGQALQSFDGYKGGQILVLPDGQTFLSYDRYNHITQWSIETGECLRKFEGVPACYDFNHIVDLAFLPDLSVLIAATCEGVFYFWDFDSGDLLASCYNLDEGYLWVTPPDEFAPNGWLHTDRPDLVSLTTVDEVGKDLAYIPQADERFTDYMQLYNDEEMVMTRINNRERYRELLRLRLGSKDAMKNRLLVDGREFRLRLTTGM